jgi:phosphatidylserine decarboxylase
LPKPEKCCKISPRGEKMSILKEGFPFIIPSFIVGLILIIVTRFLSLPMPVNIVCIVLDSLLIVFALFCIFFFRDPKITVTKGDKIILSPCNGKVMEVAEEDGEKIIRVFLSIFSVHLQRAPVTGTVIDVTHKDGKFFAAWNPRAHVENEQNVIIIKNEELIYTVRQIAGFLARRCVSWVKPGDVLNSGDKIGMIKFSSQVDLHLPKTADIKVAKGDKVKAGISIMAERK